MPEPSDYDEQPTSYFTGITYPGDLSSEPETVINFSPSVELAQGEWDVNFANGVSVHVMNTTSGVRTFVTLLGGDVRDIPVSGTAISFTQNYV